MKLRVKNISNAPSIEKCIEMVCGDFGCERYILEKILRKDGKINYKYKHGYIEIEFVLICDRRYKENK